MAKMSADKTTDAAERRLFLKHLGKLGLAAALAPIALKALDLFGPVKVDGIVYGASKLSAPVEAWYYDRVPGSRDVICRLCPRNEKLGPGRSGFCRGRQNISGKLVTHAYGRPCVLNIDPVGKGPLSHFHPEMEVLSIAHAGCNLRCLYCQNWQFSQKSPLQTRNIEPFNFDEMAGRIRDRKIGGISFTYTEADYCPEFTTDFAQFCGDRGLFRTLCTAGYINSKPFKKLLKQFEAVTITFKGADEDFYRKVVQGSLAPVLDSMILAREEGVWLEVATLIVPTLNDDISSIKKIAGWINRNLGSDTPWHLERFDPQFKLRRLPPTPQSTLEQAVDIGREAGLKYVYISNMAPHSANHTYCPSCGKTIIKRLGFKVLENKLQGRACFNCRTKIPGVWG